jgi:hypothetical protein
MAHSACCFLLACLAYFLTLKMDAILSYKASANSYQTTQHHIPEESTPYFGACSKIISTHLLISSYSLDRIILK